MTVNAFLEKHLVPNEDLIREKLQSTYPILQELRKLVKDLVGVSDEEWKYYGIKNGWILKTFHRKRNLFFLLIQEGFFKISFVFGDRAVSSILHSDISAKYKQELSEARKYSEGRLLSIDVKDRTSFKDIEKLLSCKGNN